MARIFRAKPDARPVVEPQTAAFWLLLGHLEPFEPPDPLYPFAVHNPARVAQERRHPPIAIAAILSGQGHNILRQGHFVVRPAWHLALCRAMLPQDPAHPPFRDLHQPSDVINTAAASRGA